MAKKAANAVLIILTLTLALLFAACAIDIYRDGIQARRLRADADIYTPDAISSRFRIIRPFLAAWFIALLANCVFKLHDGEDEKKTDGKNDGVPVYGPLWLRYALLGLALVLTVLGILNGGLRDVLVKAVNICTECIGLG